MFVGCSETTTQQLLLCPQELKNLISPPGRQKALIISVCCKCLSVTLVLSVIVISAYPIITVGINTQP